MSVPVKYYKSIPFFFFILLVIPASAQQWEMVWSDEFDGAEVDTTRWEFQLGDGCAIGLCGWGNNEAEWYQSENASVADGVLTITAKEEEVSGRFFTSARMRTIFRGDWTFGRFEIRAKLPTGQGLWPAIWMMPTDNVYGGWAASGEIDIMELRGSKPEKIHGTIHFGGSWPNNTSSGGDYTLPSGTFAEDFHVFAIEWESGEIRWYVDDILFSTKKDWGTQTGFFPAPFDQRFHMRLNVAVGGNFGGEPDASTEFPQSMEVDYVRVFREDPSSTSLEEPSEGLEFFTLNPAYPNPFNRHAQFDLTLTKPQQVRVEVFDLMGRSITVIHDGMVPGNQRQTFAIDGRQLPSGIYWYRIVGESFAVSRSITVFQ